MSADWQMAPASTGEQFCQVDEISLCYESMGDPNAENTAVLIMGLGLQMVWWKDDFCAELVNRGFRVVRFDNRDVGKSSHVPGPGVSALGFLRRRATATYSLADLADDTAGLIAAVAPDGAHVVGVSLGSLIAQEVAIRHPGRTRSLVSIMGRPGDGRTGTVAKRMLVEFVRPGPIDPIEGLVAMTWLDGPGRRSLTASNGQLTAPLRLGDLDEICRFRRLERCSYRQFRQDHHGVDRKVVMWSMAWSRRRTRCWRPTGRVIR